MKQLLNLLGLLLGGILVGLLLPNMHARAITATPPAPAVQASACETSRSVQTTGTAVVNIVPDRALIQLGAQSNAASIAEVQESNNRTMQMVLKALKDLNVDTRDIATDWYYVEPVYSSYDSLSIKGYRINNTVAITLRDVKRVNEVISAALEAGANQVVNVELYTSELRMYRDQAREMAVQAAREKADLLAGAAGAQTDCVMEITESVWSYYYGGFGRNNSAMWTQNVAQNIAPAGGEQGTLTEAGAVALGQISIQAQVTATYSLR